jgi:hypothetical protein
MRVLNAFECDLRCLGTGGFPGGNYCRNLLLDLTALSFVFGSIWRRMRLRAHPIGG